MIACLVILAVVESFLRILNKTYQHNFQLGMAFLSGYEVKQFLLIHRILQKNYSTFIKGISRKNHFKVLE